MNNWRTKMKRRRDKSTSIAVDDEVSHLWEKKSTFISEKDWILPAADQFFTTSDMPESTENVVANLQEMKRELNEVKSRLSDKDILEWHRHTSSSHRGSQILHPAGKNYPKVELKTQAWFKFHEILYDYKPVTVQSENLVSVHLCEAPGAFVTSLNHYLKQNGELAALQWRWLASTLNPYYEGNNERQTIVDDRLIKYCRDRWYFGVDDTGDLMVLDNLRGLQQRVSEEFVDVHLVTADGSISCQDEPAEQERLVFPLQYCEVLAALSILSKGGSFLLKMFTMFEVNTACLIYLLCCVFDTVNIKKPVTSKSGNSELYVVCLGYQGFCTETLEKLTEHYGPTSPQETMIPPASIPVSFWSQLAEISRQFKEDQLATIIENIELYENNDGSRWQEIREVQRICQQKFYSKCRHIGTDQWVCPESAVRKKRCNTYSGRLQGSWNERRSERGLGRKELLQRVDQRYEGSREEVASYSISVKAEDFNIDRLDSFQFVTGKRVSSVILSMFCSAGGLADWNTVCKLPVKAESAPTVLTSDDLSKWNIDLLGVSEWPFGTMRFGLKREESQTMETVELSSLTKNSSFSEEDLQCIIDKHSSQVNYIVADCCAENTDNDLLTWELRSKNLLLAMSYLAVHVCQPDADVIIFFPSPLTRFTAGILSLLAICFQEVSLHHSSNPHCHLQPLVMQVKGRKVTTESKTISQILKRLLLQCASCSADVEVLESVPITLLIDTNFQAFLMRFNDSHLKQRLHSLIRTELLNLPEPETHSDPKSS